MEWRNQRENLLRHGNLFFLPVVASDPAYQRRSTRALEPGFRLPGPVAHDADQMQINNSTCSTQQSKHNTPSTVRPSIIRQTDDDDSDSDDEGWLRELLL